MDRLATYRQWIQELLTAFVQPVSKYQRGIEEQLIFDTERDHYQVLAVGWDKGNRVYFTMLHLDIKDNKIWLQENSTDFDIIEALEEKGVPKSDIVLAIHPQEVRSLTDYAVGV
jgi:hypothetical protein